MTDVEEKLENACRQAMFHYIDTSHWEPFFFLESLAIYSKSSENLNDVIIGQIIIKKSPECVMRTIENINSWEQWFKYKKTSKLLKKLEDASLWYFSTKHVGPIFGRELVLAAKKMRVSSLDLFVMTSVDFASTESKFFKVKATCYFYCFILEKKENDCNLTVLFHDDPKGITSKTVHSALSKRFMKRLLVLKSQIEAE